MIHQFVIREDCMFLIKFLLFFVFAVLMYYGGAGTQSDSTSLQGLGFMGVLGAFIVLFILFKIMWRAVSFLMGLAIFGAIILFILYSLGIIGGNNHKLADIFKTAEISEEKRKSDEFNKDEASDIIALKDLRPITEKKSPKIFANIDNYQPMSDADETQGTEDEHLDLQEDEGEFYTDGGINPFDYPSVTGRASVVTGSVLKLEGIYVKLLGIEAPDLDQSCSDQYGRSYACGKRAKSWLQDYINNAEVKCHILGNIVKRKATGVCFLGDYDIAAVIANAGWAVAHTKNTDMYIVYEDQAMGNKRGLWDGKFYRPHDWRRMKAKRAIAIANRPKPKIQTKSSGDGDWTNLWGMF